MPERHRATPSPLLTRVEGHLVAASSRMKFHEDEEKDRFKNLVKEHIDGLASMDIDTFPRGVSELDLKLVGSGIRPEGVMFSVLEDGQKPKLVKLFNECGLRSRETKKMLATLQRTSTDVPRRILGMEIPQPDKLHSGLTKNGQGFYFASAEIMARTIASILIPEMSEPVVLTDKNNEPVGFYVRIEAPVRKTEPVYRIDTFFDLEIATSYPKRGDLPKQASDALRVLRKANVFVYLDHPSVDLEDQLLLDENGKFVTFGRLGYLL